MMRSPARRKNPGPDGHLCCAGIFTSPNSHSANMPGMKQRLCVMAGMGEFFAQGLLSPGSLTVVFSHPQGRRRWECGFFQVFYDQVDQLPDAGLLVAMEGNGTWGPGGLRASWVAGRNHRAGFLSPVAHWARQARRQGTLQGFLEVWVSSSSQTSMRLHEHQERLILSEVEIC